MTILVVDDEPVVLGLERLVLVRAGFAVIAAATGSEAIRLFNAHRNDIDLVVMEVSIAGDSGFVIASHLQTLKPGLRTLFVSGYSGANLSDQYGFAERRIDLLEKPFLPAEFVKAVKERLPML